MSIGPRNKRAGEIGQKPSRYCLSKGFSSARIPFVPTSEGRVQKSRALTIGKIFSTDNWTSTQSRVGDENILVGWGCRPSKRSHALAAVREIVI